MVEARLCLALDMRVGVRGVASCTTLSGSALSSICVSLLVLIALLCMASHSESLIHIACLDAPVMLRASVTALERTLVNSGPVIWGLASLAADTFVLAMIC